MTRLSVYTRMHFAYAPAPLPPSLDSGLGATGELHAHKAPCKRPLRLKGACLLGLCYSELACSITSQTGCVPSGHSYKSKVHLDGVWTRSSLSRCRGSYEQLHCASGRGACLQAAPNRQPSVCLNPLCSLSLLRPTPDTFRGLSAAARLA